MKAKNIEPKRCDSNLSKYKYMFLSQAATTVATMMLLPQLVTFWQCFSLHFWHKTLILSFGNAVLCISVSYIVTTTIPRSFTWIIETTLDSDLLYPTSLSFGSSITSTKSLFSTEAQMYYIQAKAGIVFYKIFYFALLCNRKLSTVEYALLRIACLYLLRTNTFQMIWDPGRHSISSTAQMCEKANFLYA